MIGGIHVDFHTWKKILRGIGKPKEGDAIASGRPLVHPLESGLGELVSTPILGKISK